MTDPTVRQDFDEVGRRGLDLLLHNLGALAQDHRERVMIAPEFVVRRSTAPAPAAHRRTP